MTKSLRNTGRSIRYTGEVVFFESLKSIIGIKFLRLRKIQKKNKNGIIEEKLADLNFIAPSGWYDLHKQGIFIVRFNEYWQEQLLDFINNTNIEQKRPNGESWFEEY